LTTTYDSSLSTNRDWVRFLIGDTDSSDYQLQDEEIDAILVEQSNKYLAAARALSGLQGRWAGVGRGVAEKQVGRLRKRWGGVEGSNAVAISDRIAELRQLGTPGPSPLFKGY
jgi:hypothetical protein